MAKTRNSEVLKDFVAYCKANPEQRFWQALRNWSGYNFIFAKDAKEYDDHGYDTFYWEGKQGRNTNAISHR